MNVNDKALEETKRRKLEKCFKTLEREEVIE